MGDRARLRISYSNQKVICILIVSTACILPNHTEFRPRLRQFAYSKLVESFCLDYLNSSRNLFISKASLLAVCRTDCFASAKIFQRFVLTRMESKNS